MRRCAGRALYQLAEQRRRREYSKNRRNNARRKWPSPPAQRRGRKFQKFSGASIFGKSFLFYLLKTSVSYSIDFIEFQYTYLLNKTVSIYNKKNACTMPIFYSRTCKWTPTNHCYIYILLNVRKGNAVQSLF